MRLAKEKGKPTHIYPIGQDHDLTIDCWCHPVLVDQGQEDDLIVHRPPSAFVASSETRAVLVHNQRSTTVH